MVKAKFTVQISKEGRMFVAYARKLDACSCGYSKRKAFNNLMEVVGLLKELRESQSQFKQGKGKSLKSLKDLRTA